MARNTNNRCKTYKFCRRFSFPENFTEIEMLVHGEVASCLNYSLSLSFPQVPQLKFISSSSELPECFIYILLMVLSTFCCSSYMHMLYSYFSKAGSVTDHCLVSLKPSVMDHCSFHSNIC